MVSWDFLRCLLGKTSFRIVPKLDRCSRLHDNHHPWTSPTRPIAIMAAMRRSCHLFWQNFGSKNPWPLLRGVKKNRYYRFNPSSRNYQVASTKLPTVMYICIYLQEGIWMIFRDWDSFKNTFWALCLLCYLFLILFSRSTAGPSSTPTIGIFRGKSQPLRGTPSYLEDGSSHLVSH